jgi:hypothetical protein
MLAFRDVGVQSLYVPSANTFRSALRAPVPRGQGREPFSYGLDETAMRTLAWSGTISGLPYPANSIPIRRKQP